MNEVKVYRGRGVSVQFNAARCIHAAECVHGLPRVFDPQARPWIQPAKATLDELVSVVARCPTGALHAIFDDGRDAGTVSARNELRIVADGPHHLRGDIEIRDDSGKALARETRMALCRCGASGNKPYCDNSHVGSGFKDEGTCKPGEMVPVANGPLTLTLCMDGPVQCDGPVTIFDAFGDQVTTGAAGLAMPLRRVEEQALLRRQSQGCRLQVIARFGDDGVSGDRTAASAS